MISKTLKALVKRAKRFARRSSSRKVIKTVLLVSSALTWISHYILPPVHIMIFLQEQLHHWGGVIS
jgi:hypothetical protein